MAPIIRTAMACFFAIFVLPITKTYFIVLGDFIDFIYFNKYFHKHVQTIQNDVISISENSVTFGHVDISNFYLQNFFFKN